MTLPGFNSNDVLLKCIERMKDVFNIDRWQINQPIIVADLYTDLASIMGVQSIAKIEVFNQNEIL